MEMVQDRVGMGRSMQFLASRIEEQTQRVDKMIVFVT